MRQRAELTNDRDTIPSDACCMIGLVMLMMLLSGISLALLLTY